MIDLSNTFDTTNALSSMFLWLMFGYLSVLLNCDLQRLIKKHPLVLHFVGILAFFFLFTIIDSSNKTNVVNIWLKTIFIYLMFILLVKSKWYFVVPVLGLLLIDQTLKKDIAYRKQSASDNDISTYESFAKEFSRVANVLIIIIIIVGTIHYAILQKREYKDKFSWMTFFFGFTTCKDYDPLATKRIEPKTF